MTALVALTDGAVVLDAAGGPRGRVRLLGPDARAFLHRMSTNHVTEALAGSGKLNVLTTDKGRIVDVVHHLDCGERGVLLVGSAGRGPAILAWLDRYLFSEKVELVDESSTGTCLEVAGHRVASLVGAAPPPWGFVEKDGATVVRTFDRVEAAGARVPSFFVIGSDARFADLRHASADESEAARIAAGVPSIGGELVDKHNPLDLGLHDAIHWNKGCYIGQEVIARLDTYQKQHKVLATLTLTEADRARVAAGAQVLVEEKVVGEITTVAPFTWGDRPNALAVAKVAGRDRAQVRIGDDVIEVIVGVPAVAQSPHE